MPGEAEQTTGVLGMFFADELLADFEGLLPQLLGPRRVEPVIDIAIRLRQTIERGRVAELLLAQELFLDLQGLLSQTDRLLVLELLDELIGLLLQSHGLRQPPAIELTERPDPSELDDGQTASVTCQCDSPNSRVLMAKTFRRAACAAVKSSRSSCH